MSEIFIKSFTGHSGCQLDLYKNDTLFFVRKRSLTKEYNIRLKKQCIKQAKFKSSNILAPQVLATGVNASYFYFDMEFVAGLTLAKYMSVIKTKDIMRLIQYLFTSLPTQMDSPKDNARQIFAKKIETLKKKITLQKPIIQKAFFVLGEIDFSQIPYSFCHGDLTLENIIIVPETNKIYLIDFLDSFYNSWEIDLAKILQDLELGWSWRHDVVDNNRALRAMIARQALIESILDLPNGNKRLLEIYGILLLNILRIYPYTKDRETFEFLDKSIQKVIDMITRIKEKKI